ncbi:MAG TPA: 2Fe-2S iron-sulfur cluster-binding protein, partial [Pseudogulbenkiania sp.]|nr:2Fe-2S iron-sulfur cluster-binding protein [Pseudogulbenkiania sp.]
MSGYRVHRNSQRINDKAPVNFRFDGKQLKGFAGDTLASALIANGVRLIGRSFKYGRPRGIVGHGSEEPNALIQLETGGYTVPDLKATQVELYDGLTATTTTGFPSLHFDLKGLAGTFSRFMPPGFYYKTFMGPVKAWPLYEKIIRKAAGYGRAPVEADPEFYDHLHHHVDVLVVGGGACGLWAATLAGRAGLKTLLVEEQSEAGGWMLSDASAQIDGKPAMKWVNERLAELDSLSNVTVLTRTTAFAHHEQNLVQALELVQDHLPIAARDRHTPRQRLHKIRAHHMVLATGSIERPLVYGNNDRPGVMTAAAAQTYLNRYGVAVGRKVLLMTHNDAAYDAARDLAQAGSRVTLIDTRLRGAADWRQQEAKSAGVELMLGYGIAEVHGKTSVSGARLVQLDPFTNTVRARGPRLSADSVLSSGGLTSTVHLFCHNNGRPYWNENSLSFVVPDEGRQGISCAGSITGRWELG